MSPASRPQPDDADRRADRAEVDVSIDLDAPPSAVWRAFTTGDGLGAWFGANSSIDARPGGGLRIDDVVSGVARCGVVDRVEPDRLLDFRWWPVDRPGVVSRVAVRIEETDGGSRVSVTESIGVSAPTALGPADVGSGPPRRIPGFAVPGTTMVVPSAGVERVGSASNEVGAIAVDPAVAMPAVSAMPVVPVVSTDAAPIARAGWVWRMALLSLSLAVVAR